MAEFLYRIGGFASRRSRTVVVAWLAILAVAGVAFTLGGGHLATGLSIPGTPTAQVTERLAAEFPAAAGGSGTIVFRTEDGRALTDAQKARSAPASPRPRASTASRRSLTRSRRRPPEPPRSSRSPTAGRSSPRRPPSSSRARRSSTPRESRPRRRESSTRRRPELATKQAQLDQGKAQLEAQRDKLDQGAALLEISSGIRLVSEDGSAAVAPVMFKETQFEVAPATKQAVEDAFDGQPIPRRRGRLLLGDRRGHPQHLRRRRARRPDRRRRSSSWSCSAP